MAPSITAPAPPGTAAVSARPPSKASAGACTASGPPIGSATPIPNSANSPFAELAASLSQVVSTESPVHWREAARRVLESAGIQRLGNRLEPPSTALSATPPIRDRRSLPNPSRKLDLIAPEEIEHAILITIEESCGMTRDEVPSAVCRLFGFSRVTEDMKSASDAATQSLLQQARLHLTGGTLQLPA